VNLPRHNPRRVEVQLERRRLGDLRDDRPVLRRPQREVQMVDVAVAVGVAQAVAGLAGRAVAPLPHDEVLASHATVVVEVGQFRRGLAVLGVAAGEIGQKRPLTHPARAKQEKHGERTSGAAATTG